MVDIIKIEWLKIRSYSAFWWVLGTTALAYPGLNAIMVYVYKRILVSMNFTEQKAQGMIGSPFGFAEVWHTVGYFSSWFVFIPAILVIMLMTNEYAFKTHRQNIINGWTRGQFLTGKLLDVAMIALLITVLYVVACVGIGATNTAAAKGPAVNQSYFIGYFLLQTFAQLSIAFFIAFLMRNAFTALTVFIVSLLIVEPILGRILEAANMGIEHFLPFQISNRLIPPPGFWGHVDPAAYQEAMRQTGFHVIYTLVFTALLWAICFWVNRRRDL